MITFCSSKNNINPNSHRFRRRCHEKVGPFSRFHAECHFGIGGFDMIQMVNINLFNGLKNRKKHFSSVDKNSHNLFQQFEILQQITLCHEIRNNQSDFTKTYLTLVQSVCKYFFPISEFSYFIIRFLN